LVTTAMVWRPGGLNAPAETANHADDRAISAVYPRISAYGA
jgi:hypothetical protein